MSNLNRIEDIDLYLVGACICFAVGGNTAGSILLGIMVICWTVKRFMRGLRNEE